jgi:plasmid replication initiation protein
MKPHLLSLQSHFTMYDPKYILGLSSTYSIRIYELLKQYEKIRKRVFDLQDFKKKI